MRRYGECPDNAAIADLLQTRLILGIGMSHPTIWRKAGRWIKGDGFVRLYGIEQGKRIHRSGVDGRGFLR